jgi:hypothetical protein
MKGSILWLMVNEHMSVTEPINEGQIDRFGLCYLLV